MEKADAFTRIVRGESEDEVAAPGEEPGAEPLARTGS